MAWLGRVCSDLDWVDQANSFWSVLLLSALAVSSFLLRIVWNPFTCWTPNQFTGQLNHYTQDAAIMGSTLYSATDMPGMMKIPPSQHLAVPLVLFLQALAFLTPYALWRLARPHLAPSLHSLAPALQAAQAWRPEESAAGVRESAGLLLASLKKNRMLLSIGYLTVKLLACVNLLAQFIALSVYFGSRLNFLAEHEEPLPHFPNKVIVEFDVRRLSNVQRISVQCLVPINDVFIRLFVFLWYWLLFLGLVTFLHTLLTAATVFLPALRDRQLELFLRSGLPEGEATPPTSGDVSRWVAGTLGADGALLVSLASSSLGPLTAARLVKEMWGLRAPPQGQSSPETSPPMYGDSPPSVQCVPMTLYPSTTEADADAATEKVPI